MPKLYWEKKDKSHIQESNYSQNAHGLQTVELIENPIISSIASDIGISKNKRSRNQEQKKSSNNWKNLLIWGENLIYIDPPYATGGNFESKTFIGESNTFEKKKAYSDIWDGGIDEYIDFLYDRLLLMKSSFRLACFPLH